MKLYFHSCPRPGCRGPVEFGSEPQFKYLRCVFCGWRVDMPVKKKVKA